MNVRDTLYTMGSYNPFLTMNGSDFQQSSNNKLKLSIQRICTSIYTSVAC